MPSARAVSLTLLAVLALAAPREARTAPNEPPLDPTECIERTTAQIRRGSLPRSYLQRAACEESVGKLVEALRDDRTALEGAVAAQDSPMVRAARARIGALTPRVPRLILRLPSEADDLVVTVDGQAVPLDSLGNAQHVNPGKHAVHAEGTTNGAGGVFDKEFSVNDEELVELDIVFPENKLTAEQLDCVRNAKTQEEAAKCFSKRSQYLTSGQLECLLASKSEEEVTKCLPRKTGNLAVKTGFEISGYSDSTYVNVMSPRITASIVSPTAGWNLGGSYIVDVVSAASPDIVSEASPPFREVRQAGTLGGGYKPGLYGVQLSGNVSSEPDYLSLGGGVAFTAELNDKLTTPRVAFNYSHDTIGRSTTPFSIFHHNLDTAEFEGGCTFVMSSTSILLLSGTVQLENGDQSKPYRYIPMFDPATAAKVKPGQSYESVNAARESIRPLEQLPLDRKRYAVGMRFAHRFSPVTLRLEERLYYDSWQQAASTTDLRLMADLSSRLRMWPHVRMNVQDGVSFYRLAYSPIFDPVHNVIAVPAFRTDDREDSPLLTLTAGGGIRYSLSPPKGATQFAITAQTDVAYSRFFQSLFITSRTALYGTLGLEGEFE